jgi:peptide/nickel transport system permease protein
MPSVVTLIGLQFGYILGGTIVTEEIFSLPGMGRLIFRSINMRDYFVVQGILLFAACNIIMINLITDIAIYYLDPRIRYE